MSKKLYNIIDTQARITRVWGLNLKEAKAEIAKRQREYRKGGQPGEECPDVIAPMPEKPTRVNFCEDEAGHFPLLGTAVLAAAAQGRLDLNAWARSELANRGLDRHGRWVGCEAAKAGLAGAGGTTEEMRQVLLAVKALWDKHGLGDYDAESEPVFDQLISALGTTAK